MPLRRLNSLRKQGQPTVMSEGKQVVGLFARVSNRGNTKKTLDASNEASVLDQGPSRQSVATDSSSSVGEDHGPVDLDEIDEKRVEQDLIRYFEEDGEEKDFPSTGTGPIDLDLLDDNFHYYDKSLEDHVDQSDDVTVPVENIIDIRKEDILQKAGEQEGKQKRDEAREDQISDRPSDSSELSETTDDDEETVDIGPFFGEDDEGEKRKSAPVDMDDVHDLEATFDSILDEHEDNFMVWTANRKSINAIISAEEQAVARVASQRYGRSLRRERKRWSS
jgi:hypothetical protein